MSLSLLCNLIGHRRNKRKIRRKGEAFVSVCKRCHTPMVRRTPDAAWSAYDPSVETFQGDPITLPATTGFPTTPKL